MTIDDIFNSGYTFELEDKKCSFDMITYQTALKTQNALYLISTNDVEKGNEIINRLAIKHLKVNKSRIDTLEALALTFKNPFAIVEVNAQFLKYVNVFMNSLPSFQQVVAEK